jgi:hypothetical protein
MIVDSIEFTRCKLFCFSIPVVCPAYWHRSVDPDVGFTSFKLGEENSVDSRRRRITTLHVFVSSSVENLNLDIVEFIVTTITRVQVCLLSIENREHDSFLSSTFITRIVLCVVW